MPNLRIIFDNAADRASVSASSTASSALAVANLQNDLKGLVWRTAGTPAAPITTASLTLAWTSGESIAGIVLAFCNLTPTATLRVRAYSDAGNTLLYDSGVQLACPASAIILRGWAQAANVNSYAFGGGAYARLWLPQVANVKQLKLDLTDSNNALGYLEVSRLIVGGYWSPTYNADTEATLTFQDASKHERNDASDLMTDIGPRSRKLTLHLSKMPSGDRTKLVNILRGNGLATPLLISLFPESTDLELERDHQLCSKLSTNSAMAINYINAYSVPLEFDEI
jgi:hypothetical protein